MNTPLQRARSDSAVGRRCGKLIHKLPGCLRYTKQQLNFWRDLSWHLTIGHAREWLALNTLSAETAEGLAAFLDKRPIDYAGLRRAAKQP